MNLHFQTFGNRLRLVLGLIVKETHQVLRDPGTIIVAVILPMTLLFLFGYGVSFDARRIDIGLVVAEPTPDTGSFVASLMNSRIFTVQTARDRIAFEHGLVAGSLDGIVVLAADFTEQLARGEQAPVQIIVDGSDPNKSMLVLNYVQGAWANWLQQETVSAGARPQAPVTIVPRVWFNPAILSHHYLVPGSIAIILMLIGSLLTALVVAREWERGTMEALLATPIGTAELLAGKLIPYFILGMLTVALATATAIFLFGVPFRGSFWLLGLFSAVFLGTALAQGLLISTLTRNQLVAAQVTVVSAFLPGVYLSGFIFEISGMPFPLQIISRAIPARYFVSGIQTLFLAGDIWSVIGPAFAAMAIIFAIFVGLAAFTTKTRLD
jgi:ABC-2 type transport system permease protein